MLGSGTSVVIVSVVIVVLVLKMLEACLDGMVGSDSCLEIGRGSYLGSSRCD